MKKLHIRLSHSALESFLTCERMFQLDRLLAGESKREDTEHTVFGKSFGEGVASYIINQDRDKAVWAAYLSYYPVLESDKKTEETAINLLMNAFPHLDNLLLDWEIAIFQDKPAVELSFRLNIATFQVELMEEMVEIQVYFVGYVDVVLRNKWTGRYAILENKTTGLGLLDVDPLFKNSGQALGYSIVLDKIAGEEHSEYDVLYLIGQLNSRSELTKFQPKVHLKEYPKTIQNRLNWFLSLGMDVNRLRQMLELGVFPMRGGSCIQFMRPCKHFGTCSMMTLDRYKELPEDKIDYQFTYDLQELITDHIHRS
jgi:hypothetical protein